MWGVLQVAPNSEHQVSAFLRLMHIETYAPRFPAPRRTKPGSVRHGRARWVFPGYLFFKIEEDSVKWNLVRTASGVRRVLQIDGSPAVVDQAVIEHFRRRLAEGSLQQMGSAFVSGQRVHIERGPLTALDAIFERELDSPARVQILVNLFCRQLSMTIDPEALRPAG
jgi:transcription antitermination factor NusG